MGGGVAQLYFAVKKFVNSVFVFRAPLQMDKLKAMAGIEF
jgi:hypothetical protein